MRHLERHAMRRREGLPTLSVLAGPPGAGAAAWRAWCGAGGRACACGNPADTSRLAELWIEAACATADLAAAAVARASARAQLPEPEIRAKLRDGSELDVARMCDRVAAEGVFRRILAAAGAGRDARAVAGAAPGPADVRAVAELMGDNGHLPAPALAIVWASAPADADLLRRAAAALAELATAAPGLPVALAVDGRSASALVAALGPCRLGAMLREGWVEVAPAEAARASGVRRPVSVSGVESAARPAAGEPPGARCAGSGRAASADELPGRAARAMGDLAAALGDGEADRARSAAERVLYECLEADPSTRGVFELNGRLPVSFGPARAEVDLLARRIGLAVEIDGPHHFRDRDAYRRDRRKDVLLQERGFVVSRVLAEDVMTDPAAVTQRIVALVRRRAKTGEDHDRST